jgi:hypothetical protein
MYRGKNEFKKGQQPTTNLVKDESSNLLVDPHKILNRWKNFFCQFLTVHGAGSVRRTEMHTAKQFVQEPSASEAEVAIGKLKRYKSPGVAQILEKLIQAGGKILCSVIHKIITLIWDKKELPHQWKSQLFYLFTKRVIKLTVIITKAYHCCQLHTKFYPTFVSLG